MLPEVRGFMMDLILEVVNEYPDIDGVQGDDRLPAMPLKVGMTIIRSAYIRLIMVAPILRSTDCQ